ncbi:MAG: PQQ-like beta-propeller repeat protein, partial [Eubacteriaceae bacterium]|nr:PQQ-like beta-propeller repeat protein [Eubacteriaceae bacterium]
EEHMLPNYTYALTGVHEVDGRQGIAWYEGMYYVSGSTTLSVYDGEWNLVKVNTDPFEGMETAANHIGDIDVYDGEIYAGVDYFMDGEADDLQIAVYDADTLEVIRTFPVDSESGQTEVSGITVDPDSRSVWMCSWEDGESGRYLYRYSLEDGSYLGKYHLQAPPQWIQGIVYYDGWIYITSDDGTADLGEADHIYRCRVDLGSTSFIVTLERTLDDVILQGEIEGISVDRDGGYMLISYNRGSRIVLGMVRGLYEGYEREIHEVFVYEMRPANR